MNTIYTTNDKHVDSFNSIFKRDREKKFAAGEIAGGELTLQCLDVSLSLLPSETAQLLRAGSDGSFDTHALALQTTAAITAHLNEEYHILKLRQMKEELNARIARNALDLTELRDALAQAQDDIPIDDITQNLRLELSSYEKRAEKGLTKYSRMLVPKQIHPQCMRALATSANESCDRAASWQRRAEDFVVARDPRATMAAVAQDITRTFSK